MIRYDRAYNQKITSVVSNFNRKVRRLEKEEAELLPSRVSVREIKNMFMNRRDLNTYLRELQRFSKRGAEDIVTVNGKQYTKYQLDVFRARLRRERYNLRKDIAEFESMKPKYPMQHSINLKNMRNRLGALSQKWTDVLDSSMSQYIGNYQRKIETYDNYLEVLFQDAYTIDYDETKLQYIRQKLMELSPRDFIKALEDRAEIQEIFNNYHSLTRQAGILDENEARRKFDELYRNIDDIVEKYK